MPWLDVLRNSIQESKKLLLGLLDTLLVIMEVFESTLILDLAQAVVDAGAVPLLVLCVQEPELSLKRISASALSDISKHSPEVSLYRKFILACSISC